MCVFGRVCVFAACRYMCVNALISAAVLLSRGILWGKLKNTQKQTYSYKSHTVGEKVA